MKAYVCLSAALFCLTACAPRITDDSTFAQPQSIPIFYQVPPGGQRGACWGKEDTPAIVETQIRQVVKSAAVVDGRGNILKPMVLETTTVHTIVKGRTALWFEIVCPPDLTGERIANLQRALAVRGGYQGPVTGWMDAPTQRAIRRAQIPLGLNSAKLSITLARRLGIVAYDRDSIAAF